MKLIVRSKISLSQVRINYIISKYCTINQLRPLMCKLINRMSEVCGERMQGGENATSFVS